MARHHHLHMVVAALLMATATASSHAGVTVGTSFSYQGELRGGGELVNGPTDMTFRLFNLPIVGVQIGEDIVLPDVPVVDGRFTVTLDFGDVFNSIAARFLEVEVEGVVLSPRQQIMAAPVSLSTHGIFVDSNLDVGIGVTNPQGQLHVETNQDRTVYAVNTAPTGVSLALRGETHSTSGGGVLGHAMATSGLTIGVAGTSNSPNGSGVVGYHLANTGTRAGVLGQTNSTSANAVGVHGLINTTSAGSFSAAVRGENLGTGTTGIGVHGHTESPDGYAAYFTGVGGSRNYFQRHVGIGITDPDARLHVAGGSNASPQGGGLLVIEHAASGNQLAFDGNEVQARNGGAASTLNLNAGGGDVVLAAGGGDVEIPGDTSNLYVGNSATLGGGMHALQAFVGHFEAGLGYGTRLESDVNNQVTHMRFETGDIGGIIGSITSFNGVVSYNAFTGSHYVTMREPMEPGTLMRMTGLNQTMSSERPSEMVYGVETTQQANDPACLGVYVSECRDVATDGGTPIHLVAAVGNGEMWVVDDGRGDIEPGDYLISSDQPGCAMKDNPARFAVGHIVAQAAERVVWSEIPTDETGFRRATISVLFEKFDRHGGRGELDALRAENEDLRARLGTLELAVAELLAAQNGDSQ